MSNQKIYQVVTDRIIDLIKTSGKLTWQKSWNGGINPTNHVSGKPYRGFNRMLLSFLFEQPYFMTFKQVSSLGGKIVKGSKSTPIIYWNWIMYDKDGKRTTDKDKAEKKIPFLRYYNVFNQCQIEGIDFKAVVDNPLSESERILNCEKFVNGLKDSKGLSIEEKGSRACYSPVTDKVFMPPFKSFSSAESFYSTCFHELVHWTGHSSRLDRGLDVKLCKFGDTDYSKEELVAEMGASFLCEDFCISNEQLNVNQAAYLQGWLSRLSDDVSLLVSSGGQAQKAVDWLLED